MIQLGAHKCRKREERLREKERQEWRRGWRHSETGEGERNPLENKKQFWELWCAKLFISSKHLQENRMVLGR